MSRIVTIVGAFVDRMAGLIAAPVAGTISVIFLRRWAFVAVPAAAAPTGATVQRLGRTGNTAGRLAMDQTPLVHSISLLRRAENAGSDSSAAAATRPGRVSIAGYVPVHSLDDPLKPWHPQRRLPSMRAIPAALHRKWTR